jgi:hypothetical protein
MLHWDVGDTHDMMAHENLAVRGRVANLVEHDATRCNASSTRSTKYYQGVKLRQCVLAQEGGTCCRALHRCCIAL